jgi:glucose-6-phosphate 1-dehydrogenase
MSEERYRKWAAERLAEHGAAGATEIEEWCKLHLHHHSIGEGEVRDYKVLGEKIEALEKGASVSNRIYYLALPPSALDQTLSGLGAADLDKSEGWARLVIEKPFGYDTASAVHLNRSLHRYFSESQIYRIDHYLGKETVQNLLVFRFANPVFESLWNRDRVQKVEIVVAEDLGVGSRAGYYDKVGALKDMVQNHLTQLLCLTAMEVPASMEADAIRDEKVKVLRSIPTLQPGAAVFGQYSGKNGQANGYLEEPGVKADSKTETFVAVRLEVANWRWQGVPFLLRTGKRLKRRLTQITVQFRCPPVQLFQPFKCHEIGSNRLVITLQPQEGFDLHFEVKSPGQEVQMQTQSLHFRYDEAFGRLPEAYETLLLDVMTGDQTLFVRSDETEAAWRLYTPLLEEQPKLYDYASGSWGPEEVNRLL